MLRFKKVILSVVLVLAMMAAAGCGSKSADNVPQVEGAEFIEPEEAVSQPDATSDEDDQVADDQEVDVQAEDEHQEETDIDSSSSQESDLSSEMSDQNNKDDYSDYRSSFTRY